MNELIETIFISVIGLLAFAFFVVVFVDLARGHKRANRRRRIERMEEEATAILAALEAFEKIREAEAKPEAEKGVEGDGLD